jgi:hypothetical protein
MRPRWNGSGAMALSLFFVACFLVVGSHPSPMLVLLSLSGAFPFTVLLLAKYLKSLALSPVRVRSGAQLR